MAQPYRDQLQALVAKLRPDDPALICKHFFSGAALYSAQRICASLGPQGLAFKLPLPRAQALIGSGVGQPLRYFAHAPIKRGYILLPDYRALEETVIGAFLAESIAYAAHPPASSA